MMTTRRIIPVAALAALVAGVVAGCGGGGGVGGNDAAIVNGAKITKTQVQTLMDSAKKAYAAQKRTFPTLGSTGYVSLRQQALEFLIRRVEYDQKAKALGVTVTDAQVGAKRDQVRKQYGTQKAYEAQLKSQGMTDQDVRDQIRADLVAQGIFAKLTAKVTATDAELQAYYAKNTKLFTQAASRTVSHILVADKALAFKLYKQVQAGGDFAALAKKYSLDTGSKSQGGKLTISKGQTVPQFDKVAFALATGAVSPPVQSQYGWHVIKADTAVKPAQTQTFAQVKETVRQQVLQQKRNDVVAKWTNDLKAEYGKKVEYASGYGPAGSTTG